jgi:hypothetical protein
MRCVFLQVDKKEKDKEDKFVKTCRAGIGTEWIIVNEADNDNDPDTKVLGKYCESYDFEECPRLHVFMEHEIGTSKLKVDTSQ